MLFFFFQISERKNKEKSTYVEVHVETWGFRWVCVQPNNDALPRDCATLYRWQQPPLGGHGSDVQRVLKGVERAQHTVKKSGYVADVLKCSRVLKKIHLSSAAFLCSN